MVRFVLSTEIREWVEQYNEIRGDKEWIDAGKDSIEHLQLVEIAATLQKAVDGPSKSDYSLARMLQSTSLYIEPKPIPKPVLSTGRMLM